MNFPTRAVSTRRQAAAFLCSALTAVVLGLLFGPHSATAQTLPTLPDLPKAASGRTVTEIPASESTGVLRDAPSQPSLTTSGSSSTGGSANKGDASLTLDLGNVKDKPSNSVLIVLMLTLVSVAPTLLIMLTSFTRIAIVLSLTRNALGLQSIPPNQVIAGLALFLSLFVMKPTLNQMNEQALQPMLRGEKTQAQAFDSAMVPLRTFMLKQTRTGEIAMFLKVSGQAKPRTPADISMATLIPAFILSELKTAFIIGFIIFIPFLVVDIVASSSLMSMGMMMLPPVLVSLPFKLLLFVMVDGWGLVVRSLVTSFR